MVPQPHLLPFAPADTDHIQNTAQHKTPYITRRGDREWQALVAASVQPLPLKSFFLAHVIALYLLTPTDTLSVRH